MGEDEVVIAALQQNGLALEDVPNFQLDYSAVLAATTQNCTAFGHAAPEVRTDAEFVIDVLGGSCKTLEELNSAYAFVSPLLRADRHFQEKMERLLDAVATP